MSRISFPLGAILYVMLVLLCFVKREGAALADESIVRLADPPRVILTPIDFLAEAPNIDGVLDSSLASLPPRGFSEVTLDDTTDPLVPVSYRLAYGTDFFYVYIETDGDDFAFRDRAYQNGDGFHMLLGLPKPGDAATDEFYVMAGSYDEDIRVRGKTGLSVLSALDFAGMKERLSAAGGRIAAGLSIVREVL